MTESKICTCPSGDGSLRWPCPKHPAVDQADVAAKLTFINGRPAMCGCQVEYSDGGGEYSDVIYVTLCAKHSGSAILDLVATNRIALTPEYEGQWHADLYLDREIPLAKVEGATPAEAVLALMSAERIDPEQESVEQAGGDERAEFERAFTVQEGIYFDDKRGEYRSMNLCAIEASDAQGLNLQLQGWQARAALAQPSPVRSSLLINGYQLRAALDFIAPDGTAEQLESEACIEWRQQDADFLEAGLYAFCAEYPEEGGVLLDEEPTTAQPSPLQSEQAEAERPEVAEVAFVLRNIGAMDAEDIDGDNVDLRFEDAEGRDTGCDVSIVEYAEKAADLFEQHDRIVGTLRAENAKLSEALDECDGDRWKLRSERDSALARVAELETKLAELEKQEPAGWLAYHFGGKRQGTVYGGPCDTKEEIERYIQQVERSDDSITLQGKPFYAAPAAQAQHSVPGDIMRDAQRYRWLRDQQFYFSFSTENSDAGISSCTAGMSSRFKNLSWVDAAIDSAIAAAPGKEVGHE
ncbi:hypothetical protein FA556_26665 [Pseudomonas aeruginosa]|uniref:hypothetical protein n=1 Tax=Pseudomonas aeruginosa TaxID=287 RepID=UPI001067D4AE|nr:hypothetical protein [Pseudomonas aeruginosa]MDV6847719.1 hypothetical protein [Pseudomonas aeruginosa]MDV6865079.1 hypothetical protein [Pseudomonas aeruginosa]TEP87757.1 hypothetical protein IPC67_31405 [Pseudomonas aeruginosa]HDP3650079.1 hypothetical protein [Pseudomonas aeruginosa]